MQLVVLVLAILIKVWLSIFRVQLQRGAQGWESQGDLCVPFCPSQPLLNTFSPCSRTLSRSTSLAKAFIIRSPRAYKSYPYNGNYDTGCSFLASWHLCTPYLSTQKLKNWASGMTQQIKTSATKSDDLSSIPRTYRVERESQLLKVAL